MVLSLSLFASLTGCRKLEPAPADLDGILHWFWDHADDAAPEDVSASIATLHEVGGDGLEEALDGQVGRLTAEQTASFDRPDVDPASAAGVFLLNAFSCDAASLEAILVHLAQDELYQGVYDSYDRRYTSDEAAFRARSTDRLTWDVDIAASILGSGYTESISGGVRAVETELGPALIARTWLTEPAVFEGNKSWPQDWQLEVYYEPSPGRIVHLYGMWREMDLGGGLTFDGEAVQRVTLNNLADWDEETERLCAEGLP